MNGIEKRQQERYLLHVPISIKSYNSEAVYTDEILTNDISSKGVSISTSELNLSPGEKVHMEMTLTIDKLKELFGCSEKIILKVDGSIIRSMGEGIAIEFDKKYSIFPEILRTG
jgi:hypothetical protein